MYLRLYISRLRLMIGLMLGIGLQHTHATVWVYDYPDTLVYTSLNGQNFRSPVFEVTVVQGGNRYPSYVLADYNTFTSGNRSRMTEWNHSTCFSFEDSITVEVRRIDGGVLTSARVFPLAHQIPYSVQGDTLTIQLDEPRKLYIEIPGMEEDPLFIFADGPELNIPNRNDPNVELIRPGMSADTVKQIMETTPKPIVYFDTGIHSFGPQVSNDYPGYQLPMKSNKTYYLPGGAYVVGSLYGMNVTQVSVRGRGILTSCGKERLANAASIPYNTIMFDNGGSQHHIEGITITNPAHFCILSRGDLITRNVKLFGWWHQTDGWGGNHGSELYDSFMKVNDDYVKVYRDNHVISNLVLFKQINGAAFQLGWNAYGSAQFGKVSDIYIVNDANKSPNGTSNTAVINLVNNEGSMIRNLLFERIYLEQNVQRTLGIKTNGGSVANLTIRDVYHTGTNNTFNYLHGVDGGAISFVQIQNLEINGICIDDAQAFDLQVQGSVDQLDFTPCITALDLVHDPLPLHWSYQNGHLRLQWDGPDPLRPHEIVLMNLMGQQIGSYDMQAHEPLTIPLSQSGIYVVLVRNTQTVETLTIKIP